MNVFQHFSQIILTFRPFVIKYATLKRQGERRSIVLSHEEYPMNLDDKLFALLPTSLIVWLLFLPLLSSPFYEQINYYLQLSLEKSHTGKLILAGFILVLVFTFSEIVIFLISFSIGQAVHYWTNKWIGILVTSTIILLSYSFLIIVLDYKASFATPFLVTFIYIIVLLRLKIYKVKFRYQALLLFQLLILFQWLEINPAMHPFGFGKSDTARAIIDASYIMDSSHILQLTSTLVTIPFLISVLVTFILIEMNILRAQELEKSKMREEELQHMRLEAIESRVYEEINNLVHDLKTPLTTISGLNSLIEMQNQGNKGLEYSKRIEQAVGQLNMMVSEILSEDVRRPIKLSRMLNYTRAHLVEEQLKTKIQFINHHPDEIIYVNQIRITRLLINLIENAVHATRNIKDGKVIVELECKRAFSKGEKVDGVMIRISDNGYGMDGKQLERIWDVKYSSKGSSGLGLPFVRKIVRSHGGWIKAESKVGRETTFTLFIPRGSESADDKNTNY